MLFPGCQIPLTTVAYLDPESESREQRIRRLATEKSKESGAEEISNPVVNGLRGVDLGAS